MANKTVRENTESNHTFIQKQRRGTHLWWC